MGLVTRTRPLLVCDRVVYFVLVVLVFGSLLSVRAAGVDKRIWGAGTSKLAGLIIPGFASTRLRAWTILDCPYSPLDFNPLDPVWVDVRKVLSVLNCWLKCMLLDPETQADHPECKSRPDSGLSAITELDPGYITGHASSVWRDWVNWCVEFGIEADAIIAVPYDWRLSGIFLEKRDLYFHRLKITFETTRKLKGGPSIVFAHSLGNLVFRYFLEWLKQQVAAENYNQWLDDHIIAYYAVGAPLLGAAETLKAILSGLTFGLPIAEGTARTMSNSFSSSLWSLPFAAHCHAHPDRLKKQVDGEHITPPAYACEEREDNSDNNWPVNVLTVDLPPGPFPETVAYPDVTGAESHALQAHCGVAEKRSYAAEQIVDGTFLREIMDYDPTCNMSLHQLLKFYLEDPLFNPLTPWDRPPIKNVYCTYGVDLKTELGYHLAPNGKPYPDNWFITDIIYETEGGRISSRSGAKVEGRDRRARRASGDTTVPYHSLSYCKNWLGPQVNITRTPQRAHDVHDVQREFHVEHVPMQDITPNMTHESGERYITFYEADDHSGRRTAVWEFDKVGHRNILREPVFLRELWLETVHIYHSKARRSFVSKDKREPLRDEDCYWDYGRARCGFPERCEYRYVFGDVHLGQSCRLKALQKEHLWHYLGG